MAVITGHQGNFTMPSGSAWEELTTTTGTASTGHVNDFWFDDDQEPIESTDFASTGAGRDYYMGNSTVTGHFNGSYGIDQAFPYGDLAPGTAASVLTLTTETGKTVVITANLENIELTVNRRTGLNAISADFVGEMTSAA